MQIQPITSYSLNKSYKQRTLRASEKPNTEPSFKGVKGFLTGGAIGAGVTAAGVALIAGTVALPVFAGYIAVNGAISALVGHLAQKSK